MAAARRWAGGGGSDLSEALQEARELGAPEEVLAQLEQEQVVRAFEVWPENWPTVEAFQVVSTQWRATALPGGMEPGKVYWHGLDYAGVAAGLAGHGIEATPELWNGLSVMEAAARDVLNGLRSGEA